MTIEELYEIYKANPLISTDTRKISKGCIFFALKGANFNGNAFAEQALSLGARYVIIDEKAYQKDADRYVLVSDVLTALQRLAAFHRAQLDIPVVGITGTNGKTTTKELLFSVLSQKFRTYATHGNLNNHIGVPLTLLSIDKTYEMAVVEMGANHVGEIALLSAIAQPNYGLITNVGRAHLEGFGSFEGIKRAKGELYDYLNTTGGVAFLQADNAYLLEMIAERNIREIVKYGFSEGLYVSGKLEKVNPFISLSWAADGHAERHFIETRLTGSYNLENILSAIAVGIRLGVGVEQINQGVAQYHPTNNRSQITKTTNNTIIADFYNANASSMAAALSNMEVIEAAHKTLILGDMFEMGDESASEHRKVIERAESIGAHKTIFVGKAFFEQKAERTSLFFETTEEASAYLSKNRLSDSTILLKGSRGMGFEKLMGVL